MLSKHRPFLTVFALILVVQLLDGCAMNMIPQPGNVAEPDARMAVVAGEVTRDSLQTKDLVMGYTLALSGGQFTLDGDLYLNGSILNSFPLVSNFFLKMSFLDHRGNVLATTDISPLLKRAYPVPDTVKLAATGNFPPGTKAVAFSYFGEFFDNVDREDHASWPISYFPFSSS
ncbi:MAG: hypothetical protein ACWGOX_00160 [Desulforhopalus sp.]